MTFKIFCPSLYLFLYSEPPTTPYYFNFNKENLHAQP